MSQLNRWQSALKELNASAMSKVENVMVKQYRSTIRDIKKQAKVFIDDYDNLSFSQRLEAERLLNIGQEIQGIIEGSNKFITKTIAESTGNMATNGYYSTFFALEGENELNIPMSFLDEDYIESLVFNKIDGKTFSQRLYKNADLLAKTTTQSLIQGAVDGKGYKYVAKRIEDLTEADYKRALRIARTEGGRASSISQQKAYNEAKKAGVDVKKRWISTLDEITRNSHRLLDGQTVESDEDFVSPETGAQGKGPRLMGSAAEDINCRCTSIAIVDGYDPELRLDNETGQQVKNMSYTEWQKYKGVPVSAPKAGSAVFMPTIEAKEFATVRETVDYGVDQSKEWRKTLTKDEIEAMERYANYSYDINGYAREGDNYFLASSSKFATSPEKQVEIKRQFKAMESAINKSTFKDDVVLYRGTNAKALNLNLANLDEQTLKSMIGSTISDNAYLSTTGLRDVAETYSGEVILKINVPKGTKGIFIDNIKDISGYIDEDFNLEFVLQRNQTMKITGYRKVVGKYGNTYFEVSVDAIQQTQAAQAVKAVTTTAAEKAASATRRGHIDLADYSKEKTKLTARELNVHPNTARKYEDAVKNYTSEDYQYVRAYQTHKMKNWDAFTNDEIRYFKNMGDSIEEFIEKAPKWEGAPLFRGVQMNEDLADTLRVGTILDQGGTSSWSDKLSVAKQFTTNTMRDWDTKIIFKMDATTKGTSIRHLSNYLEESEILLSKRSKQIITNIEKVASAAGDEYAAQGIKGWIVTLKEIED